MRLFSLIIIAQTLAIIFLIGALDQSQADLKRVYWHCPVDEIEMHEEVVQHLNWEGSI